VSDKDLSSCKDWSVGVSPSPSWLALMREAWRMIEGVYDDVELVMEESMKPKVVA
jgi:hypothetical protein